MKKISVIVPTYQPGGYLWECLEALRNQTFPLSDFEVLIVLNGKETPWRNEIDKYISDNKTYNFTLLYTSQPGVSNARNIALDCAKGEYIAFVDDDDYVSPTYLSELYEKAGNDTVALSNAFAFNDGNDAIQLPYSITKEYDRCAPQGKQKPIKPKKFFSGPCMKLISREIIADRRFDCRFKNGEDSLFMFLISDRIKYADFTSPSAIYYRRFRTNSATTSNKSVKYMLGNCFKRFAYNTRVYFGGTQHYSFRRYLITVLGLLHIIISEIILPKLK